jgi:hypothetical protein
LRIFFSENFKENQIQFYFTRAENNTICICFSLGPWTQIRFCIVSFFLFLNFMYVFFSSCIEANSFRLVLSFVLLRKKLLVRYHNKKRHLECFSQQGRVGWKVRKSHKASLFFSLPKSERKQSEAVSRCQ